MAFKLLLGDNGYGLWEYRSLYLTCPVSPSWPCQILLTDRFDEGLMVLRRLMGWHMIDMTYMTLRITKIPTRRLVGSKFEERPHFDELPTEVMKYHRKRIKPR